MAAGTTSKSGVACGPYRALGLVDELEPLEQLVVHAEAELELEVGALLDRQASRLELVEARLKHAHGRGGNAQG